MKQILLAMSLIFMLAGCASKRYVKKAGLLENSGLYADAADNYFASLQKNINNIDAKLGLQRTGQLVLDDKMEIFKTQYQNGNPKEAVYAFRAADAYYNKLQGVGVKLIFPDEQHAYYKEVEDAFLSGLYREASKALDLEQFTSAEKLFAEILSIDSNYKDAKSKWTTAHYEPMYRNGKELMQNKMYRSAYLVFKDIVAKVKVYHNSLALMNESLKQAKLTIYVSSVNTNFSSYKTLAGQLTNKVVKGINSINSPLYEVIGTGNAISPAKTLTKKAFQFDRTKGVVSSQPMPDAKAVFSAQVQKYNVSKGQVVKTEKKGYLKRVEKYVDEKTKLSKEREVYDKVTYYEYQAVNKVALSVSYSVKRTDRDEVPVSDIFNREEKDKMHYAEFKGDYKKLIPGIWKYLSKDSDEDRVYDSASAISSLHKMFENKKTIRSNPELENALTEACVKQITEQIKNYKPEN
ncbi:hypothetical protein SAMN06265379_10477 [Saccharicrinis carchari]|uniref:Lipoprotein n=1 Tax=Saccharicrinis carchari TaxID=1168039 RepID=A0A521CZX3_SACCC|nr:hypothetical protein [Saccharicrinis carchari]SMO64996.1 hypothetical protein SAMN06265379_10477 [Saccharicrinis carchari]